jgi:hypothetical protein
MGFTKIYLRFVLNKINKNICFINTIGGESEAIWSVQVAIRNALSGGADFSPELLGIFFCAGQASEGNFPSGNGGRKNFSKIVPKKVDPFAGFDMVTSPETGKRWCSLGLQAGPPR